MRESLETVQAAAKFSWSVPARVLTSLATSDLEKFGLAFRRLRQAMPEQSMQACIHLLATHDPVPAFEVITCWLTLRADYVRFLLDPDFLTNEEAERAAAMLRSSDANFLVKLRNLVTESELTDKRRIRRALFILAALGDYGIFLPWLRTLTYDHDRRIRSRAVKLMCELRPVKALIERQLQDDDPRVCANALEPLWHSQVPESQAIFRTAAAHRHHRVAANGLLGLFYQGEYDAIDEMIRLSSQPEAPFRAAMAWALGQTRHQRALPALRVLGGDPVPIVRNRAQKALSGFPEIGETTPPAVNETSTNGKAC
jgi:HEAT repeat protein